MSARTQPAGVASSRLNTPRSGRDLEAGKHIISVAAAVIRGAAAMPAPDAFVHFHIKRRIHASTKDAVIVPVDEPATARAPGTVTASYARGAPNAAALEKQRNAPIPAMPEPAAQPMAIGGASSDETSRRMKKAVEAPTRRPQGPRKLLSGGGLSALPALLVAGGGGAPLARSASAPAALRADGPRAAGVRSDRGEFTRLGKRAAHPSAAPAAAPAAEPSPASKRFTSAPFWENDSRPPAGADLALPSRAFAPSKATVALAAVNGASSSSLLSAHRQRALRTNESVVGECFGRSADGGPQQLPRALMRTTVVDHDGHRAKGWDAAVGRKRCFTPEPRQWHDVRAPTLANANTNVFRYHPLVDGNGKNTARTEAGRASSGALQYGANFDSGVGPAQRVGARRSALTEPVGHASAAAPFSRSSSAAPVLSRIEAPFDRATNPVRYDITYESRQTCREWKPYVRPLLRRKPTDAVAVAAAAPASLP
jgi:hypothetical protein